MIETNLNIFDAVVVAVLVLSCALAFFRGFVREVLSLSAWVLAGVVTLYFFPQLADKLEPKFKNLAVAAGFSTLGIYIVSLMFFSLLNAAILKFIKSGTDVGLLDNWLGFIFGAARGAFLIALAYFVLTIVLPENDYPKAIKTAKTHAYVEQGAMVIAKAAPKYLREMSPLNKKLVEQESTGKDSGSGIGRVFNSSTYKTGTDAVKEEEKHDE